MAAPSSSVSSQASRHLPLLVLLFAGSGCSALIYETVWYQLLQLAIGSTAVSLGFLLATFMGGLCLGSICLPRLRLAGQHPLRIYGFLELGIAACAVLVHFCLPLVNRVYIAGAEHGMPGMLLRGMVCAVCLLPPTMLMGASLPAIVRWIQSTREGVSWWGIALRRQYRRRGLRMPASPASSCCASTTWRPPPSWPSHSTWWSPRSASGWPPRTRHLPRRFRRPTMLSRRRIDWPVYLAHRDFRRHRAGRGSRVDPPPGHAARPHGLCLLHHPGGLSDRAGDRQLDRLADVARGIAAGRRWAGARSC